ncbi:MAG: hypothetical protein ACLSA6_12570 [Holdemania massiliensis]
MQKALEEDFLASFSAISFIPFAFQRLFIRVRKRLVANRKRTDFFILHTVCEENLASVHFNSHTILTPAPGFSSSSQPARYADDVQEAEVFMNQIAENLDMQALTIKSVTKFSFVRPPIANRESLRRCAYPLLPFRTT